MESPYKTPKTSSTIPSKKVKEWSVRKVTGITFLPMVLCLLSLVFCVLEEMTMFYLFQFVVLTVMVICAIVTAFHYSKTKRESLLAQFILWIIVHITLIFFGAFGCAMFTA